MAKRFTGTGRPQKTHSKKTKKRLETKRQRLEALAKKRQLFSEG